MKIVKAPVRLLIARAPKQPVVQRVGLGMQRRLVRSRLGKGMLRDGVGAAHERERHKERALDLTRGQREAAVVVVAVPAAEKH